MYPRIKSINTEDNYILIVTFENNIVKKYDFKPLLDNPNKR
jgi:hypothetical protein